MDSLKYTLLNFPGWRTKSKYLVIQSDDWGSERVPSNELRDKLGSLEGIGINDAYAQYDSLCSPEDIEAMYEVLGRHKDSVGRHPIITANVIMGNPDFLKIIESGFQEYYWEPLKETFERNEIEESLSLWKQGIDGGLMDFQYHGREHVNVPFWLNALKHGPRSVRLAAELNVFGVDFANLGLRKNNCLAAWDFNSREQEDEVIKSIGEGLDAFMDYFGKDSVSVIAPSYTWSNRIEEFLLSKGVRDMQGIMFQKHPVPGKENYKRVLRITRKSTEGRLGYQMRNVFFEPSLHGHRDQVKSALLRIEQAFSAGKPGIICMHRINFSGSRNVTNREKSLEQLNSLLAAVVKKWPEVQFIGSSELAAIKSRMIQD